MHNNTHNCNVIPTLDVILATAGIQSNNPRSDNKAKRLAFTFAFACITLLVCGWASAGEVEPARLGNCVSGVSEEGEFGTEICKAKATRSLIGPGWGSCTTRWRVIRGQARCFKSDAATDAAHLRTAFTPLETEAFAPASIGSVESFYAGRNAGENGRFRILEDAEESGLKIEKTGEFGWEEVCSLGEIGSIECEVVGSIWRRSGSLNIRTDQKYSLRFDGLMVEEQEQHRRSGCTYRYSGPVAIGPQAPGCTPHSPFLGKESRYLHAWN